MLANMYLGEACQNTFIIADCLNASAINEAMFETIHKNLLWSQRDDALILINKQNEQEKLVVEMLVLGADKTLGDFCGNGSRACAAYLYDKYPEYEQFYIRAAGQKRVLNNEGKGIYSIEMPKVNFDPNPKFVNPSALLLQPNDCFSYTIGNHTLFYTDIIEPHLILNKSLTDSEVERLGRELNCNKDVFPNGINLTVFSETSQQNVVQAVTFERGVQRLTKSCGTGACCTAAFYLAGNEGKIYVLNPGGKLEIKVHKQGVQLRGPAIVTGKC